MLATDGSELSEASVRHGVALAKALGARVTALTVIKPWHAVAPGEIMVAFPEPQYRQGAEIAAARYLATARDVAEAAGVGCETIAIEHERPWQAIIDTASAGGCDLIVMGSHGRKGLSALFLGSQTQKVLTHTRIAVLVHR